MYQPAQKLTFDEAKPALGVGLRAIADGQTHIDLAGLTQVDSAAVAIMLAWQRAARSQGKSLVFSNISANLQSLIQLYGVTELLNSDTAASESALPDEAPHKSRHDLPHH